MTNLSFAIYVLALSHLVDLAESETVREMSAIVMDKMFTTMAVNSYQGVFGSTHGRTYAPFVKGGLLEPTSGIARLMWGTGVFNHHIAGPVSLACMKGYELPVIISLPMLTSLSLQVAKTPPAPAMDRAAITTTAKIIFFISLSYLLSFKICLIAPIDL